MNMKRLLSVLLAVIVAAGMLCIGVQANYDNLSDYSKIQPIVRVRVNGSWYGADLTPYKGQDNIWVEIPIEASKLKSNDTNYFSISTNVNSGENKAATSVDLYATSQENTYGSFLCTDRWCDNNYTEYNDRRINLKVQVQENGAWKTLSEDAAYRADESTVLGQFQGDGWYNAGRNIDLGDVSGYTKARVLVNLHVGRDIQPLTDFQMNQLAQFYSYAPALRVRVNGSWYGVGLDDARGKDNTWVYCPIPVSALKANDNNALNFSTNVNNRENFSDSSVDLYATLKENASDSFVTNHQWCDDNWTGYSDRSVNARIELYDGRRWTAVPADEAYTTAEHCVLGLFTSNSTWYNAARNIAIGDVDLSKYTAARVAVNLHVGDDLQVDGYLLENAGTFLDPIEEPPIAYYTVTATAGTGGSISGVPQDKVEEGTEVTLTAAAEEDHNFAGWYRDNALVSADAAYTFTVTADTALEARFVEKGKTTFTISAEAEGGRVTGTGVVEEGTTVTLTAVPDEGYVFDGWYSGEEKVGAQEVYTFPATQNVTLIARFAKKTYTVTATAEEGGQISGVPEEKVEHGAGVTLTATPDKGYAFDGWYSGKDTVSTDATYTFTVTSNASLTARFKAQQVDDGHKRAPDVPGPAEFDQDSDKAAIRVRVNGSWYGTYLQEYKGKDSVWVPVYLDMSKLKGDEENYFHFSSNVLSHGNFTDSSVDLYSSFATENLNSFLTQHQYCDEGWVGYSDRNVNVRLELYNGSAWVAVVPQETTYYDEHTVLGQFANDGNWYNAGRNLVLGDLSGYTDARVLVQMHVGTNLDVADNFKEEEFATFIETPDYADNPNTGNNTPWMALLAIAASGIVVLMFCVRRRTGC